MFEIRKSAKADRYIGFKLTDDERRTLEQYAEAHAMSLSDFARLAIGAGIRQLEEQEGGGDEYTEPARI